MFICSLYKCTCSYVQYNVHVQCTYVPRVYTRVRMCIIRVRVLYRVCVRTVCTARVRACGRIVQCTYVHVQGNVKMEAQEVPSHRTSLMTQLCVRLVYFVPHSR